jgi:hypothetical protein
MVALRTAAVPLRLLELIGANHAEYRAQALVAHHVRLTHGGCFMKLYFVL